MTSVWGRLAVVTTAVLAFAACQVSSSIPKHASSETGLSLGIDANTRYHKTWLDPVPGTKPLFGLYEPTLDVNRRDCLANGSNYCFGNNVDFCPSCGDCCVDGNFCCGSGKVCCGTGCCSSDQICSQEKCLSSVEPVTVTSTIVQTITRIATQRATVVVAEIERSTVVSTVDVTVSTAATQTNVVWETITAVAKRAAAGLNQPHPSKGDNTPLTPGHSGVRTSRRSGPVEKGPSHIPSDLAPVPRQARQGAALTVTDYVTQTTDVTSVSSIMVTVHTTSTDVTTVYHTNTRVLKAEATTTITSTLTLTSHPPTVITLTATANPTPPPPTSQTNNPSTTSSPAAAAAAAATPLPTPAIAGIAAGSSVLALLLAGFIILSIRRRHLSARRRDTDAVTLDYYYHHQNNHHNNSHHHRRRSDEDEMLYTGGGRSRSSTATGTGTGTGMAMSRQPTIPHVLPHFATAAAPEHHAAEYKLPVSAGSSASSYGYGYGYGGGDYLGVNQTNAQHQHQHSQHHQRNGSGYTTLVGTPSPTSPGFPGVGAGIGFGVVGEGGYLLQPPKQTQQKQQKHVGLTEMQGSQMGGSSPGRGWVQAQAEFGGDGSRRSPLGARSAAAVGGGGGGARQRAYSSPSAASPGRVGSPRMPARRYQRGRAATVGELEGDGVAAELDGDGARRG
ncbi:hypothetical protein C8A01DRAFT_32949 [Parachaetomium inaequale]|uniref:Uncharacterized protein n=1 Tax=Parachaetomium inaequale TaxID=2588326 RepID=A0AAN6PPR4_9PEZI|nr:hypothetical protein C8A01DRAFT_32949 [Parachaetomium inaequale]